MAIKSVYALTMNQRRFDPAEYFEPAQACICLSLRKSARAVSQLYDDALRPSGLRATQFSLLVATRMLAPVTVSGLAVALVIDRTTLTRNLRPLKREGLIRALPGRDRREREVALTAIGEEVLRKALPYWRGVQEQLTTELGFDRVSRLLKDLGATVEAGVTG